MRESLLKRLTSSLKRRLSLDLVMREAHEIRTSIIMWIHKDQWQLETQIRREEPSLTHIDKAILTDSSEIKI